MKKLKMLYNHVTLMLTLVSFTYYVSTLGKLAFDWSVEAVRSSLKAITNKK